MARASYERWLTGRRLTGRFVIVAVVHGVIVDPVLRHSVLLGVAFVVVGAVGTIAYVYQELLAGYVIPICDYTVADVRRPNEATLGVALAPVRKRLTPLRPRSSGFCFRRSPARRSSQITGRGGSLASGGSCLRK
jgi:hypothetical protein